MLSYIEIYFSNYTKNMSAIFQRLNINWTVIASKGLLNLKDKWLNEFSTAKS